jgi:membrane-associated protease RseP (regulator of RpoE activity)
VAAPRASPYDMSMPSQARARALARVPFLNIALFLATIFTTVIAGWQQTASAQRLVQGAPAAGAAAWFLSHAGEIALSGLPFAASLIAILFAHEMGHYLMARAYRVDSTLPFFIPVPVGPVGTFGAVIRIRSAMPSRRAVHDIGAAGPYAGLIVAVPLLAWGLLHSEVRPVGDAYLEHSWAGLFQMIRAWHHGGLAAGGLEHFGDSLVTWGVQRLVLGKLPPGTDVFLHPVAFAAWVGLFVTTLNLIPIGQLDGGHVTYALLGRRRARAFSRFISWALLLAGLFVSWNWLVWWVVTRFLVGYDHPPAMEEERLGAGRKALAALALVAFALTFIPVPVSL